MAPAAVDTIKRYFTESSKKPEDFDAIITGDLGYEGSGILVDLLRTENIDIARRHLDCGLLMYDRMGQDVHAGGSGMRLLRERASWLYFTKNEGI